MGEGREASGGLREGHVLSGDKESCKPAGCRLEAARESRHGRVSVASRGLTPPSALRTRRPSAGLSWDEPLAMAPPVSFQTGVVLHLPAPVGSRLPTPLPRHLSRQGACWAGPHCRVRLTFLMSCLAGVSRFLCCLGPEASPSGCLCSLNLCWTIPWPLSQFLLWSLMTLGRLITASQTDHIRSSEQEGTLGIH